MNIRLLDMKHWLSVAALGCLIGTGSLGAALVSVTPDGEIISAPSMVFNAGVINDHQQGFNEKQNVLLLAPLAVDSGFIAPGTVVDSHMIFFNIVSGSAEDLGIEWTFDGPILGVMSDQDGLLEGASTALLGNPATLYPSPFDSRGFESNDSYLISGNVLTVNSHVTQPGDWIRVITQSQIKVPEPTTYLLLIGFLAMVAVVQRKRRVTAS